MLRVNNVGPKFSLIVYRLTMFFSKYKNADELRHEQILVLYFWPSGDLLCEFYLALLMIKGLESWTLNKLMRGILSKVLKSRLLPFHMKRFYWAQLEKIRIV